MACVLGLGLSLGRSDTSQTTHFPGLFGFVLKWHLYRGLYAAPVCSLSDMSELLLCNLYSSPCAAVAFLEHRKQKTL